MKQCPACQIEKDISEFGKNKSRKDGLQTACNDCRKSRNRNYYQQTKEHQNTKRKAWKRAYIERVREFLLDYFKRNPCVDCGEADPIVLEFDHVRGKKEFNIADAWTRAYSIERLRAEIEKCEVRCCNCHRKATAKRANTWRVVK